MPNITCAVCPHYTPKNEDEGQYSRCALHEGARPTPLSHCEAMANVTAQERAGEKAA